MSDPAIDHVHELVLDLADDFVEGGRDAVRPFLLGIAQDLENFWTVPPARQQQFLERMQKQGLALQELVRLTFVGTTSVFFMRSIILALRLAARVRTP